MVLSCYLAGNHRSEVVMLSLVEILSEFFEIQKKYQVDPSPTSLNTYKSHAESFNTQISHSSTFAP